MKPGNLRQLCQHLSDKRLMKICIVGAGAIGGFSGALFARAGHEVSLVARGAHLEVLRSRGLTLEFEGGRETFRLPAAADPAAFGAQDLVLVALKAYSIAPMLERIRPLVGGHTVVVPAINGLPWWYFYREGGRFDGKPIACLDPEGRMFAALDPACLIGCAASPARCRRPDSRCRLRGAYATRSG